MQKGLKNNTDLNISIANIFSNSHFKKVLSEPDNSLLDKKVHKYSNTLGRCFSTRKDALEALYKYLLSNYRCEYVYKNFIAQKILLGRHSLNTSTLLNEFRIASSLADVVLINGESIVYEIKTELDSPERLSNQLRDYQKAFSKVYLVVHYSQEKKYKKILEGTTTGLIVLTRRQHLSKRKDAEGFIDNLNIKTMFKCLRKPEYSNVVKKYFGEVPDVPNMFYFRECLKLANKIEPAKFQKLMNTELKKRKPKEKKILNTKKIPEYLTNICLAIDPDAEEYGKLFEYLNKKI